MLLAKEAYNLDGFLSKLQKGRSSTTQSPALSNERISNTAAPNYQPMAGVDERLEMEGDRTNQISSGNHRTTSSSAHKVR